MRPVEKTAAPRDVSGQEITYPGEDGHRRAKRGLLDCLGRYCCYCERPGDQHVEHVIPKRLYGEARHLWRNYLLGCPNCNAIKTDRNTLTEEWDCLFPDEVNTAWAFLYGPGALIEVNPRLSQDDQLRAQNTIRLTGLDRIPPPDDPTASDLRWRDRDAAWEQAKTLLEDLEQEDSERIRNLIVRVALGAGFFSVWLSVFSLDTNPTRRSDMRNRFIREFKARRSCFEDDGTIRPSLSPRN